MSPNATTMAPTHHDDHLPVLSGRALFCLLVKDGFETEGAGLVFGGALNWRFLFVPATGLARVQMNSKDYRKKLFRTTRPSAL